MRNTVITAHQKKREIIIWLVCFLIANLVNLIAILVYETSFSELIKSLGYVIVFSFVIYAVWGIVRILWHALRNLYKKIILKK